MTVLDAAPRTPSPNTPAQLELTAAERTDVHALAERLSRTPPALLDDPVWLAEARRLSCGLPVRLRQALRTYRFDSGRSGALVIDGLPIEEAGLPDTPTVAESVERAATVPAVVPLLVGLQLGEVVAYRDEKAGALVQNIVPVPGREASQSNAGSQPLQFHVENAFHPQRPDYVGLVCLRNDHAKRAGTLVASIRQALPLLSEADRAVLGEARFRTQPPPSFRTGSAVAAHPVLCGSHDDPDILADFNATSGLDDDAVETLERLRLALEEVGTALVLQSGQMAFVDNRIVLHGRTHFTPRYDGKDRWLHRVYVHLDNRRTRPHRQPGGSVLT